jgi:hypothetical protein
MNTNKLLMKLLMASTLLALLFTTACGLEIAIKGPSEQALVKQGDVIMTVLKTGDFQAVHEVLSLEADRALNIAIGIVGNVVDLESEIMQNAPAIDTWKFDRAYLFTKNGSIRGILEGRVDYVGGRSGKVRLELEMQDGTWKLRSFSLEQ